MSESKRWYELVLPLGIIACLLVILVPLPPAVIDVLLAANITIAVIVLLTTIQVRTPLEFGIFPTLLLATTLSRVVLNIATTRLILSRGAEDQAAAAGGVIQSFGEFVAGNQIAVGIVIFSIIVVVQFVIITKGATRISEVAARFTLDGMPGRQMAIDADLNAGTIDAAEAKRRREDLQEQSDFYGAMDGASKFVRGDAIAGIIITAINIAGGLAIGLAAGMSAGQAAETFTKLTIGDGLVTQIPGLLISLAAGILITRSTRSSNLPGEFVGQLFSRPQVLLIAGIFVIVLIFTQLPAIPLLIVGGGCIAIALLLPDEQDEMDADPGLAGESADEQKEQQIKGCLAVDPIEIELGVNLIGLASGGQLLGKITRARESLAAELGIVLPKVRVRDNLQLQANQFQVRLNRLAVCQSTVNPDRTLLVRKTPAAADPGGVAGQWHSGFGASWVEDDSVAVKAREYLRLSPADAVVETLKHQSRLHAAEILTRQSTAYLIEQLRESCPAAVDELIPDVMRVGQVQQVLQRLLTEGVSIRPLNTILEALADAHSETRDVAGLTEAVRCRLSPWITASLTGDDGSLRAIQLDKSLQSWLERQLISQDRFPAAGLDAAARGRLVDAIKRALPSATGLPHQATVIVNPRLRPALREELASHFPRLAITSSAEISRNAKIETIAILRLGDVHYAAA
ncbi:MAG: FHIPEP family type III secretion protein [Pirellulaceae bacterium]